MPTTLAPQLENNPVCQSDREELIESMLPLVKYIVARMSAYLPAHVLRDDLTSAGVVGLMDAVDRYDESKGSSLKTYCTLRIRGAILDELRRMDWVPRSVHRDSKRLAAAQDSAAQRLGREPMDEEVRAELGMTPVQFERFVDRVKPTTLFSLQEPAFSHDTESDASQEDVVADPNALDASEQLLKSEDLEVLMSALGAMPRPHQQVLTLYYIEDLQLKEIAKAMRLTESRVSQIHTLALSRLQATFRRARLK